MEFRKLPPEKLALSKERLRQLKELYPKGIMVTDVIKYWEDIDDFFNYYEVYEVKIELWSLLKHALCMDSNVQTGVQRSSYIFLYERLTELVEVVYFLYVNEILQPRKSTNSLDG